ncbi:MAG TPA: SRPBCC domain-containing protein [Kofleriaceae bacterium]|nr:SRPBCC domain-containing protein [Kofleriaceae bacterium]
MQDPIHQELVFETAPARIYEVLTDAGQFSKMCGGAPTEIDARPGGAFSCFGGMILGRNVECAPGERLVQAWRVKTWDPGIYSIVRFELRPEGTATRVLLDHAGFPDGQGEHLAKGWHANYWEPLRKVLG